MGFAQTYSLRIQRTQKVHKIEHKTLLIPQVEWLENGLEGYESEDWIHDGIDPSVSLVGEQAFVLVGFVRLG